MRRLEDLLGTWRLRRRIRDDSTGAIVRVVGHVRFERLADGIVQREAGTMVMPGRPPMAATRTYLWSEAPGRLDVSYADGSPFHAFDPAAPRPVAEHRCGDDLYRVRYDFGRWPRWRSVWQVTGPRKEMVIVSSLTPLAAEAGTRQNHGVAGTE